MLNHQKVLKALQEMQDKLFIDNSDEYEKARTLWQRLSSDEFFLQKVPAAHKLVMPRWDETSLQITVPFKATEQEYVALSVDGSQIYPDRHQGTLCHLINIGSAAINYDAHNSRVIFDSQPYIFTPEDYALFENFSVDLVDCKRQELEFKIALQKAVELQKMYTHKKVVVLVDGSLIFWHLHNKDQIIKDYFLSVYCATLNKFYEQAIPIIGYISVPKSKELVSLLHAAQEVYATGGDEHSFEHIVDATIAQFFLQTNERTQFFATRSAIVDHYPALLKPRFCYADSGNEIIRLELPQWLHNDAQQLPIIMSLVANQVAKGYGYPVVLAEAHEQAVVKNPDREFFYHLMQKINYKQHKKISISEKAKKKRSIGI